MALVLSRKVGEKMRIGDAVVWINSAKGKTLSICIEAPEHVTILREEVYQRDREANEGAMAGGIATDRPVSV